MGVPTEETPKGEHPGNSISQDNRMSRGYEQFNN